MFKLKKSIAVLRRSVAGQLPIVARRFETEILRLEIELDELAPGWDSGSGRGIAGTANLAGTSPGHIEAKIRLNRRAWLLAGMDYEPVVRSCAITGRLVVVPLIRRGN